MSFRPCFDLSSQPAVQCLSTSLARTSTGFRTCELGSNQLIQPEPKQLHEAFTDLLDKPRKKGKEGAPVSGQCVRQLFHPRMVCMAAFKFYQR